MATIDDPSGQTLQSPVPQELVVLNAAFRTLAHANTVKEVKTIRDQAEAVRQYAKSAELGLEVQNYAAELKLRSERKAGELIAQLNLSLGGRPSKTKLPFSGPSLKSLGIKKGQSSRWQLEAKIPEPVFEQYLRDTKESQHEVTGQGLMRFVHVQTSRKRKRSQSNSPMAELNQLLTLTTEVQQVIAELHNHQTALNSILKPYLEQSQELELAQQRYAQRLLAELPELLTKLQELLKRVPSPRPNNSL